MSCIGADIMAAPQTRRTMNKLSDERLSIDIIDPLPVLTALEGGMARMVDICAT